MKSQYYIPKKKNIVYPNDYFINSYSSLDNQLRIYFSSITNGGNNNISLNYNHEGLVGTLDGVEFSVSYVPRSFVGLNVLNLQTQDEKSFESTVSTIRKALDVLLISKGSFMNPNLSPITYTLTREDGTKYSSVEWFYTLKAKKSRALSLSHGRAFEVGSVVSCLKTSNKKIDEKDSDKGTGIAQKRKPYSINNCLATDNLEKTIKITACSFRPEMLEAMTVLRKSLDASRPVDLDEISRLSQFELFLRIRQLEEKVDRDTTDRHSSVLLNYLKLSSCRFGVELQPPVNGEVQNTQSYDAWYGFYSDGLAALPPGRLEKLEYALKGKAAVERFAPIGRWEDRLISSNINLAKTTSNQ